MTKQEVIQEAWGKNYEEFKEYIDDNGWAIYPHFQKHEMIENIRPIDLHPNGLYFRPKLLSGIETNNGWTRIESEDDFPKESGKYWVIYRDTKFNKDQAVFYVGKGWDCFLDVSHWQPIITPENHIY